MGRIIGIDIGPDQWRAVLMDGQKGSASILASASVSAPDGPVSEWNWQAGMMALKNKMQGPWSKAVVLVSPVWAGVRQLTLPFNTDRKIRQVLPFELENQVCGDIADLAIDFVRTSSSGMNTTVLATTLPTDMIDSIQAALAHVGASCSGIGLAGISTAQVLCHTDDSSQGIYVGQSSDSIQLALIGEAVVRDFRFIPINKNSPATGDQLGKWMHQFLMRYQDSVDSEFLAETVYCGHKQPDLFLTETLSASEVNISPWAARLGSHIPDVDDADQFLFDHAVAAGWLGLNPQKGLLFASSGGAGEWLSAIPKKRLISSGILAGITLTLLVLYVAFGVWMEKEKLSRLNSDITSVFTETFPGVSRIVDPYQQMKIKMSSLKSIASQSNGSQKQEHVLDVLAEMSRTIPASIDLSLSRVNLFPDYMLLSGDADTFNAVDDIKKRLESSDIFTSVTITSANTDKKTDRIRFKMRIER